MELRAGIVNGYWTPRAARHGAFLLAQLPAAAAEARFAELGARQPSRSTLARLPRTLSAHWEAHRQDWEAAVQVRETVPGEATILAISVAGVLAPLQAHAAERTAQRAAAGKPASGPTGSREVGWSTLTRYNRAGARRQTVRYARRPAHTKVPLGAQGQAEAQALLGARPDLRGVYLADGADTNWELLAAGDLALGGTADRRLERVDCSPACPHLQAGCEAIWGESPLRSPAEFARLKVLLKEADEGAERSSRTLNYPAGRATSTRRKRIRSALPYFRNQRGRLLYASSQRQHLPIARGGREAAGKPLVTQGLNGSGMAWTMAGGQAILPLRSLLQSERWALAWPLLAADFRSAVVIPDGNTEVPLPLAA